MQIKPLSECIFRNLKKKNPFLAVVVFLNIFIVRALFTVLKIKMVN